MQYQTTDIWDERYGREMKWYCTPSGSGIRVLPSDGVFGRHSLFEDIQGKFFDWEIVKNARKVSVQNLPCYFIPEYFQDLHPGNCDIGVYMMAYFSTTSAQMGTFREGEVFMIKYAQYKWY